MRRARRGASSAIRPIRASALLAKRVPSSRWEAGVVKGIRISSRWVTPEKWTSFAPSGATRRAVDPARELVRRVQRVCRSGDVLSDQLDPNSRGRCPGDRCLLERMQLQRGGDIRVPMQRPQGGRLSVRQPMSGDASRYGRMRRTSGQRRASDHRPPHRLQCHAAHGRAERRLLSVRRRESVGRLVHAHASPARSRTVGVPSLIQP